MFKTKRLLAIILCAVAASTVGAVLFPVPDEEEGKDA